jgi:hypothetical protein
MSARIQVIGDEVWADGYRVATLVTDGVPATVSQPLRAALNSPEMQTAMSRSGQMQHINRAHG